MNLYVNDIRGFNQILHFQGLLRGTLCSKPKLLLASKILSIYRTKRNVTLLPLTLRYIH
jgi:hypothetical protein